MRIISEERKKARKEHTCDWCGGKIEKDELYDIKTIENEGTIYDWKNHIRCSEIYDKLDMGSNDGNGIDGDEFSYRVSDYINELDTEIQVKMLALYFESEVK